MSLALLPLVLVGCPLAGGPPGGQDATDTGALDPSPQAVVVAPEVAHRDETVVLDGSGSWDPRGAPLADWDWLCTDGTRATGEVVQVALQATGEVACTLTVTSTLGLSGADTAVITVDDPEPGAHAEWTLMVYMAADNNLEAWALDDLNELESVGSTPQVNLLVQVDRSPEHSTADGDWHGARRYRVLLDADRHHVSSPVLDDLGEVDSGDPETLADFAAWGIGRYPAERYGLVVWDHGWGWSLSATGSGPAKGVGHDESTGSGMSVARGELEEALAVAADAAGGPLDLLGMDACFMATWEVAYAVAPHARVYTASQALEGAEGWAYDGLAEALVLDPTMDGVDLGRAAAETYLDRADSGATLSVVDLDALPELTGALDDLVEAARGAEAEVLEVGTGALVFEDGPAGDRDLGDWMGLLVTDPAIPAGVADAAVEVRGARDWVVVASETRGAEVEGASGLSLYGPDGAVSSEYLRGRWAEETLWDDLLTTATSGW